MIATSIRVALTVGALASLAACGNDRQEGTSALGILGKAATTVVAQQKAKNAPKEPPPSPQQMAAEALSVNKGPLILVNVEDTKMTQVLAMTGQNANMRTYMTKNEQALIFRNGMLSGTRGLGHDLSVADMNSSAALVLAGRSGTAERVMRYYSGDGLERPIPFTCTVGPGPKAGVMIESCEGHGISFQNNYIVSGGAVSVSRQWIGPGIGYITVQELRR